jgi:hypothetical protein
MTNKWRDFEFLDWDMDPIGKYAQPKKNPRFTKGQGYPQDEMDLTGTKTYGRFVNPYGKKKEKLEMRGYGAAERGRKFTDDPYDRDPVKTNPRIPVDTSKG